MSLFRRVLLGGFPIGLVVALLATSTPFTIPQTAVKPPVSVSAGFDWESVQNQAAVAQQAAEEAQARQAAIDALNAQQAQALADQLQAAADRLKAAAPPSPAPVAATAPANSGCDDPVIAGIITATFGSSAPKALAVAGRESGCNPCGFYPSQHDCSAMPTSAAGLFQLLGHQDILDAVCPGVDHAWANPWCNTQAAWQLSGGGVNWSPWNASGG